MGKARHTVYGVYAMPDGALVYVGCSSNYAQRAKAHKRGANQILRQIVSLGSTLDVRPISTHDGFGVARREEARLIRLHSPAGNRQYTDRAKPAISRRRYASGRDVYARYMSP